MAVNYTHRLIAAELITGNNSHIAHVVHELYLVAHKQDEGLTPKEKKYLLARYEELKALMDNLSKLQNRLRKTSNGRSNQ